MAVSLVDAYKDHKAYLGEISRLQQQSQYGGYATSSTSVYNGNLGALQNVLVWQYDAPPPGPLKDSPLAALKPKRLHGENAKWLDRRVQEMCVTL